MHVRVASAKRAKVCDGDEPAHKENALVIVKRHGAMFLTLCEHLLERGYDVRFRAEGTSMLPTIHDGDAVTVGPVDRDGIEAGEIVLYRRAGRPIAHRVAEIRTSADGGVVMMVARGDGKAGDDAPVAARAILGKVVSIERQAVGSTGRKRPNMASLMRHGMSSLKHAIRSVALLARSVAVCACVLGAAVAADAQMISGSYTGDGTDNRAITELGFQPDVVIIKGDATQIGVIRQLLHRVGRRSFRPLVAELDRRGTETIATGS